MAHTPKNKKPPSTWAILRKSPKYFLWACIALFVLTATFAPSLAGQALGNVLNAIVIAFEPSAEPLLSIAIALGGMWLIIWAIFLRKKGH